MGLDGRLGRGLDGGGGRGILGDGTGLLELLVDRLGVKSLNTRGGLRGILGLDLLGLGVGSELLRSLRLGNRNRLLSRDIGTLLLALVDVPHDVVEEEVASGLLRENKGLNELLGLTTFIGDLTNDLDDDVGVRCLGVNVGNANLAILEVEPLDGLLDILQDDITVRLELLGLG